MLRVLHMWEPFQVDQHIHEVRAGLEHLRVGRVVALALDHAGQFLGDIDVGVFQYAGNDRSQPTLVSETDLDVAGVQTGEKT